MATAAPNLALENYDMSAERGFLCRHNADEVSLSGKLAEARDIALRLPQIMPSRKVRGFLTKNLPLLDIAQDIDTLSDTEMRMAMVHYSFLVQAYVWGEPDVPDMLPKCLAQPIVALADHLGQQPLLPYSGYVLDNWAKIDPDGPIELDNIYMIQNFLSGMDEAWFVMVHVVIEAHAGEIFANIAPIIDAVSNGDRQTVQRLLEKMSERWLGVNALFDRMVDRCDPYIYFERVRPYIHGWKDNPALPDGIIYEGVEPYEGKPQAFRGQTGSQSSIVPTMDSLLGIGHAPPIRCANFSINCISTARPAIAALSKTCARPARCAALCKKRAMRASPRPTTQTCKRFPISEPAISNMPRTISTSSRRTPMAMMSMLAPAARRLCAI